MQHIEDDLLALIAMEPDQSDAESTRHLQTCDRCKHEIAEMQRVVTAARTGGPDPQLVSPPPRVWEGIAAAVGHETPTVTPLAAARSRRRMPTWLAVAAGVAIGVAGAGVAGSLIDSDEPAGPSETVVATAALDPFGDTGTPGTAEIRDTEQGRVLQVRIDERTAGEGFREVWLLDPETGRLVSLGVLNGTQSTFALPEGLELSEYPAVDVSREPFDGDPAHSTDSIARGELDL